MKLAQLLEQLNQLAKERPEALEMEVYYSECNRTLDRYYINGASLQKDYSQAKSSVVEISAFKKDNFSNCR